ncbi:hypothetical protein C8K30_1011000 [Promicromonospora sp. AC04]|uniref:hypothetical protein n=1 Tax=Promicromonospora sp. AC04 TaxID=2135723 RepID=UPI000D4F8751|nr:hypothetical protein [Promicromonospora sp. AC04]PUB32474.1 hypothetical protein C8K30_1011000 [Promicromonospora sp. AC04]
MAAVPTGGFEFDEIIYVVLGGVILAAVLAVIKWIIKPLAAACRTGLAGSKSQFKADAADEAAARLVVLREQVRAVAEEQGLRVADHATGHNPTIVTYTDGSVSAHFSGRAAYMRAVTNRTVDPQRSSPSKPPRPIAEWDEQTLQDWLDEHTAR